MKKMLMNNFSENALPIDFQKKIVGGGEWCGWTGATPQYCAGDCSIQLCSTCLPAPGPAIVCSTADFLPICAV